MIRKVDVFNDSYRLKEKGAILNWLDITEIDGYFSINDKMSDIMANNEGRALLMNIMSSFAGGNKEAAGFKLSPEMMQMMGGFTLIRLCNMLGTANIKVTKEQLLALNSALNKIKR